MKKFLFSLFFFVFFSGFYHPSQQVYKNFSVQRLADGVWAVIHNDKGGHAICNAGIIDLGNNTLVFDAFINPDAALELKQAAENLTHHKVTTVINSHYHDDHIRGNQVFVPGASIISTEWTKKEIEKSEPEEQDWAKKNIEDRLKKANEQWQHAKGNEKNEALMWVGYYEAISQSLPWLTTQLPDVTFNDSLLIRGSKRTALALECKNGHTGSDAILILPKEGIVFMGDLLFNNRHPWLGDGDPDSWKQHLEQIKQNTTLKIFIPGHGSVCGKKELQSMIDYIGDLQQMAREAVKNHEADSLFVKRPVPGKYKDWWFGRFYSANLQFVYSKASR